MMQETGNAPEIIKTPASEKAGVIFPNSRQKTNSYILRSREKRSFSELKIGKTLYTEVL